MKFHLNEISNHEDKFGTHRRSRVPKKEVPLQLSSLFFYKIFNLIVREVSKPINNCRLFADFSCCFSSFFVSFVIFIITLSQVVSFLPCLSSPRVIWSLILAVEEQIDVVRLFSWTISLNFGPCFLTDLFLKCPFSLFWG